MNATFANDCGVSAAMGSVQQLTHKKLGRSTGLLHKKRAERYN